MVQDPEDRIEGPAIGDCLREGSGTPLLLLHSGFATCGEWSSILPNLASRHEVMVPTLPFSEGGPQLRLRGRSVLEAIADSVEGVLDRAGWHGPVAVAGSSYGGVIAIELAARGRARSVCALAPPWMTRATAAAYGAFGLLASTSLRLTWPIHERTARRSRAGGLALHGSRIPAAITPDDLLAIGRSVRDYPFRRLARHGLTPPLLPAFDGIDCPVLLVWGTRDRLAPMWMSRRWKSAIPQAKLVTLEGFPHFPHLRDPERVADLIQNHGSSSPAGR